MLWQLWFALSFVTRACASPSLPLSLSLYLSPSLALSISLYLCIYVYKAPNSELVHHTSYLSYGTLGASFRRNSISTATATKPHRKKGSWSFSYRRFLFKGSTPTLSTTGSKQEAIFLDCSHSLDDLDQGCHTNWEEPQGQQIKYSCIHSTLYSCSSVLRLQSAHAGESIFRNHMCSIDRTMLHAR